MHVFACAPELIGAQPQPERHFAQAAPQFFQCTQLRFAGQDGVGVQRSASLRMQSLQETSFALSSHATSRLSDLLRAFLRPLAPQLLALVALNVDDR